MNILVGVGLLLTLLMIIDCAINRRDLYWFFILVILGPLGGLVYLIYHFQSVTFPFKMSGGFSLGFGGGALKRCPRCFRAVNRLLPYEDGRTVRYICTMCKSEMELLRTDRLKPEP